jgi:hypothetical protein
MHRFIQYSNPNLGMLHDQELVSKAAKKYINPLVREYGLELTTIEVSSQRESLCNHDCPS